VRSRRVAAAAVIAVAALALAACGGGSAGGSSSSGGGSDAGGVHNVSDATGGTIRYANAGDWDSLDPGDTYYAYSWDFARLYARALVKFKSAPGKEGATLVPDLAESLGKSSDDSKTWTYMLRQGVKFEDGTPVTSKDVKYVRARGDHVLLVLRPGVLGDGHRRGARHLCEVVEPAEGLLQVEHDRPVVRRVDRLQPELVRVGVRVRARVALQVQEVVEVGRAVGEGRLVQRPLDGCFDTNDLSKSFTLKRNPNWDQATDPNRKPLPDRIEVALNVNADDIDNRLQSGDLDVAIEGTGVGPAAQGKILADQTLKADTDSAISSRLWYTAINSDVAPLDNIHCRRAVEYAADKTGYQRAYGGATGGEIASNLLPPVIPGAEKFDTYPTPNNAGDAAKAKDELAQCGQPNGRPPSRK